MNFNEKDHPRDESGKFIDKTNMQKNNIFGYNLKTQFEQDVDSILNGTYKDQHITIKQETPKVLQDLGVPNLPMLMTKKHTYLCINQNGIYQALNDHYHGLGKQLFLKLPKLLETPEIVYQKSKDEILCVLNTKDYNGDKIVVPIKINGKGNQNYIEINANIVKSVYGKMNLQQYLQRNFTNSDILFKVNKKIRNI